MAADYIRNLREETRKGFYGRIKQGLFPLPAPLGYTDQGKGNPKEFDPVKAPLVRKAFELYGTGRYTLHELADEMYRTGLRNRSGGRVTVSRLSVILNNPFYVGLIRLKRSGETFPGAHRPLIPVSLFKQVQQILNGKISARVQQHDFFFRRLLTCARCKYSLIGELQKGHIYYRCHTRECPLTCVREDLAEKEFLRMFAPLEFSVEEKEYIEQRIEKLREEWANEYKSTTSALSLRLGNLQNRLARLTDAYLDGVIDKSIFEERKSVLLVERREVEDHLARLKEKDQSGPDQLARFLELAGSVNLRYQLGIVEEKRELLQIITSNRQVGGKKLDFMLSLPFQEVANRLRPVDERDPRPLQVELPGGALDAERPAVQPREIGALRRLVADRRQVRPQEGGQQPAVAVQIREHARQPLSAVVVCGGCRQDAGRRGAMRGQHAHLG